MSLGTDLKEARISKKISLEEISQKTRIPVKYLESIEEDRFEVFPSQVYAKGFIRAYAKIVGLDPMHLTRRFNAEFTPEEMRIQPMNAEVELEKAFGWKSTLHRQPVYRLSDHSSELNLEFVEEERTESTMPRQPAIVRQRLSALRKSDWTPWINRVGLILIVLLLGFLGWKYGNDFLSKMHSKEAKGGIVYQDPYAAGQVEDKYQHLVLKGLEKCWFRVKMDGNQAGSDVELAPGEIKTYKALKSFTLKLGNAGGVDVQFNGKPLGVLGATGQVLELTLPPSSQGVSGTEADGSGT